MTIANACLIITSVVTSSSALQMSKETQQLAHVVEDTPEANVYTLQHVGSSNSGCNKYLSAAACSSSVDTWGTLDGNQNWQIISVAGKEHVYTLQHVGSSNPGCNKYLSAGACSSSVDTWGSLDGNQEWQIISVAGKANVYTLQHVGSSNSGCTRYLSAGACSSSVDTWGTLDGNQEWLIPDFEASSHSIDLCGFTCSEVIGIRLGIRSCPYATWAEWGCGKDAPEGFTTSSTLSELCPQECQASTPASPPTPACEDCTGRTEASTEGDTLNPKGQSQLGKSFCYKRNGEVIAANVTDNACAQFWAEVVGSTDRYPCVFVANGSKDGSNRCEMGAETGMNKCCPGTAIK